MKKWFSYMMAGIILSLGLSFLASGPSFAAPCPAGDTVSDIKCGVTESGGGGAKNQGSQVAVVIRVVVNILLFLIGAFAVIMIVIAGFRYVASNGDANTVSSAKNTIIYALIGLAVAFLAYALVNFVVDQLTKGNVTPPPAKTTKP